MLRGSREQRFDEKYEELDTLGGGFYGVVIKVKHRYDGKLYAIKVIKDPSLVSSPEIEAKILASLEHANIVKYSDCFYSEMPPESEGYFGPSPPSGTPASVHDGRRDSSSVRYPGSVQDGISEAMSVQEENMVAVTISSMQLSPKQMSGASVASEQVYAAEQRAAVTMADPETASDNPVPRRLFYIRMELCDSDLHAFMKIRKLSSEEVWHVMRSLVSALEYLEHRKLVHGDIKLANVLLKKNSGDAEPLELLRCTVKLGDFGLSKSARPAEGGLEHSTFERGGSRESSIKSDILSLGIILLEMLMYPRNKEDWDALMAGALYRGELPDELDPRQRTLLRTGSGGMLHPNEEQRSDVATVKKHMEMWYKSRTPAMTTRVTAPL